MITQQRQWFRSFAGGEVAEEMYGRFDLAKNQTGVKRCYNFIVTPQGALEKRSGSQYIGTAVLATARLETFIRDDGQGFLLEFGHLTTRVWRNGAIVATLSTPWNSAELPYLSIAQLLNDTFICSRNYAPQFIRRVSDSSWSANALAFNSTLAAPTSLSVTPNKVGADPDVAYTYVVSAITFDGVESPLSSSVTANNVLRQAANNNSLLWAAVSGAFRYNVYCVRSGATSASTYGFIGVTDSTSFVDDNINPDYFTQPSAILVNFTSALENYPRQVAFHDQRSLFANTASEPQAFWASGLAGTTYFKASIPPQDDQAFTYELSSKIAAPVRHILALRDVLFFTGSGVFNVYTPDGSGFTANNVTSIRVSPYAAAENIRPQEAGNSILFPLERGNHICALRFDGSAEGYIGDDISLVAAHLVEGYSWIQTAMQRAPFPIWWGVRSDGRLIGLTYVAEQQVYAWWQAELPGASVKSVAVVPEGNEDAVYVVTSRFINSASVTYIEKLKPRFIKTTAQQDAFFVDCGITYSGAPTTTITGLGHLEGEEVVALAEGVPIGPFTVTGAQITIPELMSKVQVGLAYDAELELLPLVYEAQALGVGIEKNPSAVHLRIDRSEGIEAGPSFSYLRPMLPDVTELIGTIPVLRSGVHTITVDPEWSLDGSIVLRQSMPLPAKITGIAIDFAGAE